MKPQIYFEMLTSALNEAFRLAYDQGCSFDNAEQDAFISRWNGGVNYGETVTHSCPVFKRKGKLEYVRHMTVVIYRMESGRYELTTYVN